MNQLESDTSGECDDMLAPSSIVNHRGKEGGGGEAAVALEAVCAPLHVSIVKPFAPNDTFPPALPIHVALLKRVAQLSAKLLNHVATCTAVEELLRDLQVIRLVQNG